MRKFIILIIFIFTTSSIILSCGEEKGSVKEFINKDNNSSSNYNYTIDKRYWGLWKGIDSSREIYISGDSDIEIENFKVISQNVIQLNGIYYLRASLSDAEVNGKVSYTSNISSASLSDIGSIEVIIKRLKDNNKIDKSIEERKTPNLDGSISFNVPSESEYEVEGKDSKGNICKAKVYVSGKRTEIGNCILNKYESHNFKTKLELYHPYRDTALFGDYTIYDGYIIIENTGKTAGTGLVVTLSTDNPYVYSFNYDKEKATGFSIEPGYTYRIPIEISFKFLDNWEEDIKIDVTIKDVFGRVWKDYVVAHVYRRPFYIKFNKSGNFNGYIVLPGRKTLSVPSDYYRVPFIDDETIWFFFANPQGDDVRYSIGIDTDALDLSNYEYKDIISFEDNDTENQATTLKFKQAIRSFLHSSSEEKDIDIYKYTMNEKDLNGILDPIYLKIYEYKIYDPNTESCEGYYSRYYEYINPDGTQICVSGNGDGKLNPGETAYIQVSVQNIGVSKDEGIKVELSTNDTYISIYKRYREDGETYSYSIDTLKPNEIRDTDGTDNTSDYFYLNYLESNSEYIIKADDSTPIPYKATINAKIRDKYGNIWEDSFDIEIQ